MDSDDGSAEVQAQHLQEELDAERRKRAAWQAENVRRKHNYIPFVFQMLRALAKRGKLQPLIDSARKPPS